MFWSVCFLRPSGCLLFRGSGGFWSGFLFGAVSLLFSAVFLLLRAVLVSAFLHLLLHRTRASAGEPAAMAPDPPPVVN